MRPSRLLFVLVAVALALTPIAPLQAQEGESIDTLVAAALAALSAELGTPLTLNDLDNWSWQEQFFPDASLGCPQPDMAYAQVLTRGFTITLVYAGTTYDYRLTPDAQVVILCGSTAAAAATPLPAGETPATPAAPAAAPLAPVTDDPEQLLNVALAYLSSQLATPITRRDLSNWAWEEVTWPDTALGCPVLDGIYDGSAPVRGYSMTIEYVGRSFELHMTPDGRTIMPCGDAPELTPATAGEFVAVPAPAEPAAEEPASAAMLFYTGPDGNVYRADMSDFPGQPVTAIEPLSTATPVPLLRYDYVFGLYRWSPDGQWVAYVNSAAPASLWVADAAGVSIPLKLQAAGDLATLYPPAWSPDGAELAYVKPTQTFRGPNQVMEVYAAPAPGVNVNDQPRLLATFEQQVGCGGGSGDPADSVYWRESGFMGNALTFAWLADGSLLFSPACTGQGLSRLDLTTGTVTEIDLVTARLSLNPNASRAAGIAPDANQNPALVTLDLATGERQPVTATITGTPDQVLWSADGERLYVSTADVVERLPRTGTQDSIAVYTVRLWAIDLASGESTLHVEQEGRGIGLMAELPGGGLVFSFVEDARAWLAAVESGADAEGQRAAAPAAWLLHLTPDGSIERLGYGGQPAPQPANAG